MNKVINALVGPLCLLTLAGWAGESEASRPPADLVLKNAAIYTVNPAHPWVEAIAIRDGKLVAVGKNREVSGYIGSQTEVVDLQGTMVMPGINDVHAHPIDGAYETLFTCQLPTGPDLQPLLDSVATCAANAKPGEWIVGASWNSNLLPELSKRSALKALDDASAGHPVILRDDTFHNRWVNSLALEQAGITDQSTAPAGSSYVYEQGQLTGLLKEFPAFAAVEAKAPPRTQEKLIQAARKAVSTLNGFGITAVQDAAVKKSFLTTWQTLSSQPGGNHLRVVASLMAVVGSDKEEEPGWEVLFHQAETLHSDTLRTNFAKMFLDGVPPAYTASMIEPYLPSQTHGHDFKGEQKYTLEQLVDTLTQLDKRSVGVKMHATGDGAVRQALDAIAEVRRRNGPNGPRHHIAHVTFVSPQDIPRFKALNVVADMSPMLWYPTPLTPLMTSVVGFERMNGSMPIRSLVNAGALVAAGSDWPAGQPTGDPWRGIEGMVTRRNPLNEAPGVLAPHERVDLATALKIYTRNGAQAMRLDDVTGSLEVGKSADFIVLDRNLFDIPAEDIHKTTVLRTYFKGKMVHHAESTAE